MVASWKSTIGLIFLITFLGLSGCASNKKGERVNVKEDYAMEINGDSDSGTAGLLRTVNFDFDSSYLREDTTATLDANLKFLQEHHEMEILVEGHCDERGSIQYNLALGQQRAKAVFDYLVEAGLDAKRINLISIGKEKPIAFGHAEDAWSQNRRTNFVLVKIR